MKKVFNKLGFRKMDEMERYIGFKAQRNAYVFLIAALFIWSMYESYKVFTYNTQINLLPSMLLCTATGIHCFSQLALTRNAVKDDEEACEGTSLLKTVFWVCIAAAVTAAAVTAVIMGVMA